MTDLIHPFSERQKMNAPDYEVHHYRDSYLREVALHHHDFYEIYFFLSGNVKYIIESQNYQLQPWDILLISPMELHQPMIVPEKKPYERIVIWLSKEYMDSLRTAQTDLTQCFNVRAPGHTNLLRPDPQSRQYIEPKLQELLEEHYSDAYGGDIIASSMIPLLLTVLNRLAQRQSQRYELEDRSSPMIAGVLRYINDNYRSTITLDELAAQFFVSKYHLSREFRRLVGTSVYRYIIQKRLVIAKQMMAGGHHPTSLYEKCGFSDYSNFYRSFKAEYGISPKEFAQQASVFDPRQKENG
ncbi:AraC family transcriptional regulator [Gorillibacterium sp. sgz5001074]|uniref:AraC family transcriptional regulator n=1 Tax=Gorillibacterium sp. sgz5001074 TaxID=3446695 RepID=UPI003F670C45